MKVKELDKFLRLTSIRVAYITDFDDDTPPRLWRETYDRYYADSYFSSIAPNENTRKEWYERDVEFIRRNECEFQYDCLILVKPLKEEEDKQQLTLF